MITLRYRKFDLWHSNHAAHKTIDYSDASSLLFFLSHPSSLSQIHPLASESVAFRFLASIITPLLSH